MRRRGRGTRGVGTYEGVGHARDKSGRDETQDSGGQSDVASGPNEFDLSGACFGRQSRREDAGGL